MLERWLRSVLGFDEVTKIMSFRLFLGGFGILTDLINVRLVCRQSDDCLPLSPYFRWPMKWHTLHCVHWNRRSHISKCVQNILSLFPTQILMIISFISQHFLIRVVVLYPTPFRIKTLNIFRLCVKTKANRMSHSGGLPYAIAVIQYSWGKRGSR